MLDLCRELEITVNELLNGEKIDMSEYETKAEQQLLEMAEEKERKDRELLNIEVFIGVLVTVILLACVFVASFVQMPDWARIVLIVAGFIPFVPGVAYAIRIEQIAGFYVCKHCQKHYVPKYTQVLFAMHSGRTRYMQCPECKRKSWQKKVLKK